MILNNTQKSYFKKFQWGGEVKTLESIIFEHPDNDKNNGNFLPQHFL